MSQVVKNTGRRLLTSSHSNVIKDVLEKKIEDLSRQLAEERQTCRKEKSQVIRLQRELSRHKGDRDKTLERDKILKEIEKERMLRADAEKRLHDMTVDSETCHSRLENLQGEFRKMEEMVKNMMQYKTKIDQLKQEKSSLSITYENNLQKYRNHISNLERENMMLLNDVKRIENQTQMEGKIDDRSKLLLERLKMLEAENSALVLENEQQRQQYEKCLDEIANQVVQALLAQKALREECVKLQKRVQDLEHQNKELNHMFQHKNQYGSDSVLQSHPPGQFASTGTLCDTQSPYNSVSSLPATDQITTAISLTQTMHLSPMSQYILQNTVAQKCLQHYLPDSTESLQSIFTDYNCAENLPKMSMPPVWEGEGSVLPRQRANTDSTLHSMTSHEKSSDYNQKTKIETEFPATPSSPKVKHVSVQEAKTKRSYSTSAIPHKASPKPSRAKSASSVGRSKIAQPIASRSFSNVTNAKERSVQASQSDVRKSLSNPDNIDRVTGSPKRVSSISNRDGKIPGNVAMVKMLDNKSISHNSKNAGKRSGTKSLSSSQSASSNSGSQAKVILKQSSRQDKYSQDMARKNSLSGSINPSSQSVSESVINSNKLQMPQVKSCSNVILQPLNSSVGGQITPTEEKINAIKDSLGSPPSVPLLPKAQYFYDYSDEDSDINRPISADFSTTSTVSLNELLEDDDTDTLLDEDFTAETFAFFESPTFPKSNLHIKDKDAKKSEKNYLHLQHQTFQLTHQQERGKTSSLGSKPDIVKDTMNCETKLHSKSPHVSRRRSGVNSSKRRGHLSQRPSSLILAPREKQFLYHGYSSSSLSSTDSDEAWCPRLERQCHPHKVKRKSSSSSNRSSYNSPSHGSDRQSLKSSQELVTMETCRVPASTSVSSESLSKQNSIITVASVSQSTESLNTNSLTRRKGPPPPVPKKPLTGKKSPGIRMGVQSPGFRQNKGPYNIQNQDDPKDAIIIPKPHEFKMDLSAPQDMIQHCNSNQYKKDLKQVLIPKYVSSDSSFEGSKLDKVERSGSKDDGYSTMSSDVQPEVLEKYSDSSLNKTDTLSRKESLKGDGQNITPILNSKLVKSSPETISDPDSVMESSSHSSDMKNSSPSLSSPNSVFNDDKNATCGSLGRVKAMRMFFEAENQNKQQHFPLRKSPSVDSNLCPRSKRNPEAILKRYSLGDEIRDCENENTSNSDDKLCKGVNSVLEQVSQEKQDNIKLLENKQNAPSVIQPVVIKPVVPEKSPSFHPLHLSEENFLSDIPEEKDEWEQSTCSSVNQLEMSYKFFPFVRQLEQLNMFKARKSKRFWSSLQGLARVLSDSEINCCFKSKSDEELDKILLENKQCDKPLERSVSLSGLNKLANVKQSIKVCPRLHRSVQNVTMDEFEALEHAQEIAKKQILQQLTYAFESESDDDWERLSFSRILENQQRLDIKNFKISQKMGNVANIQHPIHQSHEGNLDGRPKSLPVKEGLSKESSPAPFSDEQGTKEGQSINSSIESSPCQEVNSHFRSDYYSLCMVGSKGSLFSGSTDGDMDQMISQETTQVHTCQDSMSDCIACKRKRNTEEFDEISRQLASLSKTVNALHQSLSSLNSHDSDTESNEDQIHAYATENFHDTDGYQWVEDEFYLTPCGGEIIMGNSPFSDTGACVDWVNEYIDDTSCNDEFEYYGNLPNSDTSGTYDFKKMCSSISEEGTGDNGVGEATIVMDTELREGINQADDASVLDPKLREAMLDSMIHLSEASMDSLDDNIGVDHVMCSRLLGRRDKDQGPVRSAPNNRQAMDLSKFFVRYGEHEKEAVAAFDFLNDISTSPDTSQQEIQPLTDQSPSDLSDNCKTPTNSAPPSQFLKTSTPQPMRKPNNERKGSTNDRSSVKSVQTTSSVSNSTNTNHETKLHPHLSSNNQVQPNKLHSLKKEPQGAGNSFTSKLKQPQGTIQSSTNTTTNDKSAKVKAKEEKKLISRLPRKLIPVRDKTKKTKSESKIPKATK